MYYRGVQNPKIGYYDGATEKLMAGAAFPDKAAMGDVYLCGDYEYRLNEFDGFLWWTVNIKDKTKEKQEQVEKKIKQRKHTPLY